MRVGIDAHMVGARETGNETYIRGLVDGLAGLADPPELRIYHVGDAWRPLPVPSRFSRLTTGNPYIRLGVDLPTRARLDGLDVLHTTYAGPLWSAAPTVLTVHDVSFATNPEWFSRRDVRMLSTAVPWSIRRAARVITVSSAAREQILERFRIPEEKVAVIPNGVGPAGSAIDLDVADQALRGLGIAPDRPYLLGVGTLQPRKNLGRLVEAFARLIQEGSYDGDLVLAGPARGRWDGTQAPP
ncbi:MAG: glycosyltransferase [Candidatus Dormibacterales bacterium]